MGQYYKICNLDAKAYLNGHDFGDGIKLMEFGMSGNGTISALAAMLIMTRDHRGPWAGHRIVVAGDYADEGNFVPPEHANINLYQLAYGVQVEREDGDEGDGEDNEEYILQPWPALKEEPRAEITKLGLDIELRGKGDYGYLAPDLWTERTFDQPEDVFALFGAAPVERLQSIIDDISRVFRCTKVCSPVGWGTVTRLNMEIDKDTGKATKLEMDYRADRENLRAPITNAVLHFPATTTEVREFFKADRVPEKG